MKLGQSDTERAVKVVRRVEPRFAGFDEVQLKEGKRDRAMQEVFICENSIAFDRLPLKKFEQEWNKTHLSAWKKDSRARPDDVSITNFLRKEVSNLLFLEK